jgi:hypothetical protein
MGDWIRTFCGRPTVQAFCWGFLFGLGVMYIALMLVG